MNTRLIVPTILLLITFPSLARAQSPVQAGAWTFSPLLGIAFVPDGDASLSIAGALAYHVTPVFAVEGELGHVFDTASDDPNVDASLTTAHFGILYFFDAAVQPYVAAGIGAGHYSVELRAPRESFDTTEIGFNLGGGLIYPVDSRLGVRGDFRYFKHIDNVPSSWRFSGGITWRLSQ